MKQKVKGFSFFLLFLLLFQSVQFLFPTPTYAKDEVKTPNGTKAEWRDVANIKVTGPFTDEDGMIFHDREIDSAFHFTNNADGCNSYFGVDDERAKPNTGKGNMDDASNFDDHTDKGERGFLLAYRRENNPQIGQKCIVKYGEDFGGSNGADNDGMSIELGQRDHRKINYYFDEEGKFLVRADNDSGHVYEKCPENTSAGKEVPNCENTWLRKSETTCRDTLVLDSNYNVDGKVLRKGFIQDYEDDGNDCKRVNSRSDVFVGNAEDSKELPRGVDPAIQVSQGDGGDPCQGSGFFGWILCPLVHILGSVVDSIQTDAIEPLLQIKPLDTSPGAENSDINNAVYQVWQQFRNLANILFIIVFFVIIFSQALGTGLDAYNIKKMLPRLIIAVIAVQISFYVTGFILDLGNILGHGVGSIIEEPFNAIFGAGGQTNIAENSIALVVGAGAGAGALFLGGGLTVLAPLLTAAVITILVVLATLAIRTLLIYVLIMIAPLAFVAMVLPNTEQWFQTWWKFFFRAVMMYPIIEALFAVSTVLSKLAGRLPH